MARLIRNLAIASLLTCLLISGNKGRAQSGAPELLDLTIEMHIQNGTFLQALSTLAADNRIPIGFEPGRTYRDPFNLNIEVSGARLKDILDQIVQQRPDYRWETRDGVIDIIPVKSKDELVNRLLNTRIQRFAPQKGLNQFALRDEIIALPEVQSFLKANMITASHYGYFYRPNPYRSQLDLSGSEIELRGVLNKVIRDSNYKMWIVSRSGDKLEYLDIGL